MEKIKFRGKRKDNSEWIFGDLIHLKNGKNYVGKNITTEGFYWEIFEVDPETVGQYTNLKDKKGKEMYEGDIVKKETDYDFEDKGVGVIEYRTSNFSMEFGISLISGDNWAFYAPDGSNWNVRELEIIGNKFDNPELIQNIS